MSTGGTGEFEGFEDFEGVEEPQVTTTQPTQSTQPIQEEPDDFSALPTEELPTEPLKEFDEKISHTPIGTTPPLPSFPFRLLVQGKLTPAEQETVLDFISQENFGIRKEDLAPQLEAGQLLLPQISEYAAISVIQLLMDAQAHFTLEPTTAESDDLIFSKKTQPTVKVVLPEGSFEAENLPILSVTSLGDRKVEPLGIMTATATLRASSVEARESTEYREMLSSLEKEIQFKAFRKGADAVVGFSVSLAPLGSPGFYRMQALGTAVKYLA